VGEQRALVLGVGNELRGDDGAGPAVARALRERGIPAVEHGGDPASLIKAWASAEAVVLVAASLLYDTT
jgi:hydrogenase maturation protease